MAAGGPSLRSRALLAVALTVSFYLLAITIALGLIAAPIAVWAASGHGNLWLTVAMIGAGLAILRAIVPPRNRFEPPGPELRRTDHPRLHALLDEVAGSTGEAPADAVYLDLDLNAGVFEHRKRRMMLLGLPLLATLSPEELRAVIAHEYGHYAGGDTRFSAWIWRTRHAVLRTVQELATSESGFRRNFVRWPFQWYALLFLRVTNAISRRQEFSADRLSARAASPEAAGSALRRVEALSPVFPDYWSSDFVPMLDAGKRPPLAAGFAQLAAHADVAPTLDEIVRTDVESEEPDPYASHPTLRQRLEALGVPVDGSAPAPADPAATSLLENLPELERQLLGTQLGDQVAAFPAADWADAAEVHAERVRALAATFAPAFADGLTIGDAGAAARDIAKRRAAVLRLAPEEEGEVPEDWLDHLAVVGLSALVTSAALEGGASLTARPGEALQVHHGGGMVQPLTELERIAEGEQSAESWRDNPVVAALAAQPLGDVTPPVSQ